MKADDVRSTPTAPGQEIESRADSDLYSVAKQARVVVDAWSARMTEAAVSGRGATTIARMATARATSELRKLRLPPPVADDQVLGDLHDAVAAYLKRLNAIVMRAAHEVERNRYTLDAMHGELERLGHLYSQIFPSEESVTEAESAAGC